MTHLTSSLALSSDALCYSSKQILGLDKLKLLNGPGSEPVTALAEIALLHAFLTTVVLTGLHHPVIAAVRAPAMLSSHRSSPVWYMPQNIMGVYHFVKRESCPIQDEPGGVSISIAR